MVFLGQYLFSSAIIIESNPIITNRNMKIKEHIPLSKHSTMRLGGKARFFATVKSREDIAKAAAWAKEYRQPVVMIGKGSNIVWTDIGFDGLVLVNELKRFEIFKEDDTNVFVTAGSGELWDDVVAKTVKKGFSGVETLSLIPGTTGAAPVQNIGAYGQEIRNVLVNVEAYDRQAESIVTIPNLDCRFGYRTSRFKSEDKGRFLISAITLHLTTNMLSPPFYDSLQAYLTQNKVTDYSVKNIRNAVVAIRSSKLPNPDKIANNGSFFENPIVTISKLKSLQKTFPSIYFWDLGNGTAKLSAAWMMDAAGFKDYHDPATGMGTWPLQSLVLINEKAKTTRQLIEFRQMIVVKIRYLFGIELVQEPELLGTL